MCDPVTAMWAATGVQAAGSIVQGFERRAQAESEAGDLMVQAAQTRDAGRQRATRIRRDKDAARSAAVAQQAASGVKIGEGSALEVERQIETVGETDAFLTLLGADRQAAALERQAGQTRRAGRAAVRSGFLGAGTSLLSTYATVSRWDQLRAQNTGGGTR